ncbi:MAG: TerB family tellurite resistance protein [Planctomycetota bacterium]
MNLSRTRETGDFYCPTCSSRRGYQLRATRPFLTLYFIPTIPIGAAELFVRCTTCKSRWDESVLEMDEESHEAAKQEQFSAECLRAAMLLAISDGSGTEAEVSSLQDVFQVVFGQEVEREELGRLCSIARSIKITPVNYVQTVGKRWDNKQREQAIQVLFLAASADGDLSDERLAILSELRDVLEMSDGEFERAIEKALALENEADRSSMAG